MGLEAGDRVMVHSSLSSMGHVEGGAATVVQAFLDVLVEDDRNRGALGKDCALNRLIRKGGCVFLLGWITPRTRRSNIGEDYAGAGRHGMISPEKPKGVILNHPEHGEMEVTLTEMMGSTVAFERMEEVLRARADRRRNDRRGKLPADEGGGAAGGDGGDSGIGSAVKHTMALRICIHLGRRGGWRQARRWKFAAVQGGQHGYIGFGTGIWFAWNPSRNARSPEQRY